MSSGGKAAVTSATFYIPAEQLEAWFARARPGAQIAYARGPGVDARSGVAATAQEWGRSGEAELFKRRDPASGELLHCLRRRRAHDLAGADVLRRVDVDDAFRESPEGKIFLTLVRAANLERAMPSNAELATIAGLRDADQARYLLHEKLVKAGRIELRHDGAGNRQRRAKIIETGRWTAEASASASIAARANSKGETGR